MPSKDKKQAFSLWYVFGALFLITLLQDYIGQRHRLTLSYSEFKQAVAGGQLQDLVIADGMAMGTLKTEGLEQVLPKEKVEQLKDAGGEHRFATVLIDDPGLVPALDAAKVRYGSVRESKLFAMLLSWVAPALVFFGIWWLLMKRMGGAGGAGGLMSIGKSKAKVYMQQETGVTFKDVAGIDEAREELMEVVEFLQNPDRSSAWAARSPRAC